MKRTLMLGDMVLIASVMIALAVLVLR